LRLSLTDMSNANDLQSIDLSKTTGGFPGFTYKKFNKIESEAACGTCDTYNKTVLGVMAYIKGGKLWMDKNADLNISLNPDVALTDFASDTCEAELTVLPELGTDENERTSANNSNDDILVFKGCGKDKTYIDFYDTNRTSGDYKTSVRITGPSGTPITPACVSPTNATSEIECDNQCYNKTAGFPNDGMLKCSEDTKLWSPRGADLFTATFRSDDQLKAVEICHPTKKSYMTYFLGKEKTEDEMIGTINAEDVGKLKKIGCCEATVKSFGLSSGNATNATGTCQSMKTVGTLMVLDKNAAGTGNKIVVGGPSANTLAASAGVTPDEIKNADGQYVIKLVNNNTLVVAGWEAAETNAATRKVVDWLLEEAHKA